MPLFRSSPLTHQQRVREAVRNGNKEGRQGGFCARMWALYGCEGNRDGDWVATSLRDPSRGLRALAFSQAPRLCPLERLREVFGELPRARQRHLLLRLRGRQPEWVDETIEAFAHEIHLQPLASRAWLERQGPSRIGLWNGDEWMRLGRTHPQLCAGLLAQVPRRGLWKSWVNLLLGLLPPASALELLQLALQSGYSVHEFALHRLLKLRPQEVCQIYLEDATPEAPRGLTPTLVKVAPRLLPQQRRGLLERGWLPNPEGWMRRLPPSERDQLWRDFSARWLGNEGIERPHRLAWLGPQLRAELARRHLHLTSLRGRPTQLLPYASYLPWDECRAFLQTWLSDPQPELRAEAWAALIGALRFQREQLLEVLQLLAQRRFEPDPVRGRFLKALAELPPCIWESHHLAALEILLDDALKAADLSPESRASCELLVCQTLRNQHCEWSLQQLLRLFSQGGRVYLYGLERRFSVQVCQRLDALLPPLLQKWVPLERHRTLLGFASSLGVRLRHCPNLLGVLESICQDPRGEQAAYAFQLLHQQARSRLPRLIERLLAQDASWILNPVVADYASTQAQNLLEVGLGGKPIKGRFATGKIVTLPTFERGFERWLPTQQEKYARLLTAIAGDRERDFPSVDFSLRHLVRLPELSPAVLEPFASLQEEREIVRERAVRLLGSHDHQDALLPLLDALDDSRARFAIYSIGRLLRQVPPSTALERLRQVSSPKLTVQKEVLRLAGELRGGIGLEFLLEKARQPLGRDLRIALQRSLWSQLSQPAVWPLLEELAGDSDDAVARHAAQIPLEARYLERIEALWRRLLEHPEPRVRLETLERIATSGAASGQGLSQDLLPYLEAALDERSTRHFATHILLDGYARRQPEEIARLANRPQRASALCAQMLLRPAQDQRAMVALAQFLQSDLKNLPLTLPLLARALAPADWMQAAERLAQSDQRGSLTQRALRASLGQFDRRGCEQLLNWQSHPQALWREFALEVLVQQSAWDEGARQRLAQFARDDDPAIASQAAYTFPPE